MRTCRSRQRGTRSRRRAGVLLEVVIALAVLVTAMGILGAQVVGGLNWTAYAEEQLRAAHLADRALALIEFDPNVQQRIEEAGTTGVVEEAFGEKDFPGYFWRVQVEPVDRDDPNNQLGLVTLEILRQKDAQRLDEIDGAEVLRTLAFLRAPPATIDLSQILPTGMDPNVAGGLPSDLAGQLGPLLSALGGFDTTTVTFQQIVAQLDQETLQAVMPVLLALMGQMGGGESLPGGLQGLLGRGQKAPGEESGPGGLPGTEGLEIGGGEPPMPGFPPPGRGGGPPPGMPPVPGGPGRGGMRPPPMPGLTPPTRPPAGGTGASESGVPPSPRPRRGPPTTTGGSGEGGRYTLEDLMRMRDEWRRQQEGAE